MKLMLCILASLSRIDILRKCVMLIWQFQTCLARATSGREKLCSEIAGWRLEYQKAKQQLTHKLYSSGNQEGAKTALTSRLLQIICKWEPVETERLASCAFERLLSSWYYHQQPLFLRKWGILAALCQLMKNSPLYVSTGRTPTQAPKPSFKHYLVWEPGFSSWDGHHLLGAPPCPMLPGLPALFFLHCQLFPHIFFFSLWSFWRQESILISLTLLPSLRSNLIQVLRGCLLAVKVSISLKEKWYDG